MRKPDTRVVMYALGHRPPDVHSRAYIPVFTDVCEARAWLDRMMMDNPYKRTENILWVTLPSFNFTIRCEQLDQVLAATGTAKLRDDIAKTILRFKYGTWDEVHAKPELLVDSDDGMVVNRAPKPDRAARVDKPDAFVSITELCATLGMPARVARAALRASGRVKPDYGWAFAPSEIPDIKKLISIE